MTDYAVFDNDIIIKVSCFDLVDDVLDLLAGEGWRGAALALAPLVVPKQIKRNRAIVDRTAAVARAANMFARCLLLEPTDEDIALAADLESAAAELSLALDSGESMLLAMLIRESVALLLTGDKRAIAAMEPVTGAIGCGDTWHGKLGCLEQLLLGLLGRSNPVDVRNRICRESASDRAVSICFSCASSRFEPSNAQQGLVSYVRAVRTTAPSALHVGDDLSSAHPAEES